MFRVTVLMMREAMFIIRVTMWMTLEAIVAVFSLLLALALVARVKRHQTHLSELTFPIVSTGQSLTPHSRPGF